MRSAAIVAIPLIFALTACVDSGYGGDRVHETARNSMAAAGIRSISIENVAGPITVRASNTDRINIETTKSANDTAAISSTHVDIARNGDELTVQTRYEQDGWFSHHNGASVSYIVTLPANVDLDVRNVSGSVSSAGSSADVSIDEVSGSVTASVGRVAGTRRIRINSVSGSIEVAMDKDSDVRVEGRTVSGGINAFFSGNVHKGFVGESLDGRLGGGSASMTLSAVSGGITIRE